MKIRKVLCSLVLIFPTNVFSAVSDLNVIDFAESLSISGKSLEMRLPKKMMFIASESKEDRYVFASGPLANSKMTYQKSLITDGDVSRHIEAISNRLESNYDQVKTESIKSEVYDGLLGRYQVTSATFSYFDHGQATAISVVSYSDSKWVITVIAESKHKNISKAVLKSKKLVKKALIIPKRRSNSGSSLSSTLDTANKAMDLAYKVVLFRHIL